MDPSELHENLRAITDRFYKTEPVGLLGRFGAPFDTSKPNYHDKKQDFLNERDAVSKSMTHIEGLLELLIGKDREGPIPTDVCENLTNFVDARAHSESSSYDVSSSYGLVRRNSSEVGLSVCAAFQIVDVYSALNQRKQELDDQEVEFWSGNSRPPNHYARTIALRFARFVATNTHTKPTFGTSRDGSHPSTDFGRALEEIFTLLEIKANVKNAATWAIGQLTQDEISPPVGNALAGYNRLFSLGSVLTTETGQGIDELVKLMEKDSGT